MKSNQKKVEEGFYEISEREREKKKTDEKRQ